MQTLRVSACPAGLTLVLPQTHTPTSMLTPLTAPALTLAVLRPRD